jgi:hypothetical protein
MQGPAAGEAGNLAFLAPFDSLVWVTHARVAQLDRASGYEPEGREFESLRAHHLQATLPPSQKRQILSPVSLGLFDLFVFSAHLTDCFFTPHKAVILSEAPGGSIA